MYKIDLYTDHHHRCGDILASQQNSGNLLGDCRIMKNRVIRDDTSGEGIFQL
jgi:hypothetical protein